MNRISIFSIFFLWVMKLLRPKEINNNSLNLTLLKKIKNNWKIIHYNDPTLENKLIYRGLFKDKSVNYVWDEDKHILILLIAYSEVYGYENIFDNYYKPIENLSRYRKIRREKVAKIKQLKLIEENKNKPVWP